MTEILTLLGFPAIMAAIYRMLYRRISEMRRAQSAMEKGIQALLRAQMISDYNKYVSEGAAPIYARENFENCWNQYHALGANGVMDDLHEKFLALPTKPQRSNEGGDNE